MNALCVFLISVFFLYIPMTSIAPASFAAEGRVLVFGRVQDDPVRAIRDRQEFVDYLGRKLAPVGKVLAFDEPHSTSAHILPRMLLAEKNLNLIHLNSPGGAKPNTIGYLFGADGSATNLLITGRVDAAATSLREFEELRPEVKDALKVLGKSKSAPRLLIAIRKGLDQKLHKSIHDVLTNMDKDPEGLAVLKRQQKTTKIDDIPTESQQQLKAIEKFVFSLPENVDAW